MVITNSRLKRTKCCHIFGPKMKIYNVNIKGCNEHLFLVPESLLQPRSTEAAVD
jgi:hypothetical protein